MFQEISAAIAAVKTIKDTAKVLADIDKQFDQAQLKIRLVELVSQITELNAELIELREKARLKEDLAFYEGVYWKLGPEDEVKGGRLLVTEEPPFCPRCFEADGKAIHMTYNDGQDIYSYECPECNKSFSAKRRPTS